MNFKDYCEKENPESVIKFSEVYFGDAKIELNKVEDLYPYYNHIISKMTSLNGYQKIYLGNSEIDEKEKDRVSREILKVLKLFKKNGKDFKNSIEINNSLISLICVIVENTPELKKFYLTKDEVKFIKDYLIGEYFSGVHDSEGNKEREEFLSFLKDNGYKENNSHPVILKLKCAINYFKMMEDKFAKK